MKRDSSSSSSRSPISAVLGWLTENAQAEVERYHYHLTVAGQDGPVVRVATVPLVRFAVDVHDDGILSLRSDTICKHTSEKWWDRDVL